MSGVKLDLVFDPPWTKNMMSEAARLQLGIEDVIPSPGSASMKLTSHEEYGLRCLIRLGQEGLEALTILRSAMPKASRRPTSASSCGCCALAIRHGGARYRRLFSGAPGQPDRLPAT